MEAVCGAKMVDVLLAFAIEAVAMFQALNRLGVVYAVGGSFASDLA